MNETCSTSSSLFLSSFVYRVRQEAGTSYGTSDCVWVTVCRRPAVFKVPTFVLTDLTWDPDTGPTISHTSGEVVDAGGLVLAREASLVVLAPTRIIHLDVLFVSLAEFLNGFLNMPVMDKNWFTGI